MVLLGQGPWSEEAEPGPWVSPVQPPVPPCGVWGFLDERLSRALLVDLAASLEVMWVEGGCMSPFPPVIVFPRIF